MLQPNIGYSMNIRLKRVSLFREVRFVAVGLTIAAAFCTSEPAVSKTVTSERLHALALARPEGRSGAVTYVSDLSFESARPGITRAVLAVHGTDRDGARYWRALARAARRARPETRAATYLVAPQFFTRRDVLARGLPRSTLAWRERAWKEGDPSRSSLAVSSFEALDALMAQLADRTHFPDLRTVVLVGHSAGAQFVQRYAAASAVGDDLQRMGVATRYVVINPSSYLYLDDTRPGLGTKDRVPPSTLRAKCPGYNRYKYGLERANAYFASLRPEQVKARYGGREVVYLLGERDDDPDGDNLDGSCAAMMQGRSRLERGRAFLRHLVDVYGEQIRDRHRLEIVPRLGHEGARILRSRKGLRWLFDVVRSEGRGRSR